MPAQATPAAPLRRLAPLIRAAHPRAQLGAIEGAETGLPGFRVLLPNGVDVVVGVDIDLPAVLFEVVRLYVGDEVSKYDFEHFCTRGFAGTSKLSMDAVLQVLCSYAGLVPV
ncbi:hypothetical protein [Ramlibacter albus]|uniref:Uncharacterized protein n=1 Tax=Ramlibacter albus TaxID=2079448 RepID=A0A923S4S2_9BURK|nr:hypothetical protein [Ramlibacter albus]MBC5764422.1 hypothetical protein [Ramlibacter albus]